MKVVLPTATESAVTGDPQFSEKLQRVFLSVGAQATYSNLVDGKRVEYALIEIDDISRITGIAEPVFRFLGVKPEFLPEVAPTPYYGRVGY